MRDANHHARPPGHQLKASQAIHLGELGRRQLGRATLKEGGGERSNQELSPGDVCAHG
jgi:hypothetical protein